MQEQTPSRKKTRDESHRSRWWHAFWLFLLAQALAVGLAVAYLAYLKPPASDDPVNWSVEPGIVIALALSLAFFLAFGQKEYFLRILGQERFSFQGMLIFLFSFLPAALTGLVARGVVSYFLDRPVHSVESRIVLYILFVGLPFLAFDLLLLIGDIFVREYRHKDVKRTPFIITSLSESLGRFADKRPGLVSLLVCAIFYVLFFLLFHLGYEANDDVYVAAIASGYLGGSTSPFLIFSNVLLGFLLELLYKLPTRLNWEVLFFISLNFLSVWAMLYQIFRRSRKISLKLIGLLVVLICNAYFLIRVNFTSMAAFAALAGLVVLFSAFMFHSPIRKGSLVAGGALLLAASLVRMDSVLLVLLIIIPALAVMHRLFDLRRLVAAALAVGLLIGGSYLFDHFYISSSPAWQTYTVYTRTRSALQDTPRLTNLANTYPEVGWSQNDYSLFVHWFFPDPQVYSLENLQTLVADTPPARATLSGSLSVLLDNLSRLLSLSYLYLMAAVGLVLLTYAVPGKKSWLPFLLEAALGFILIVYLIITMKLPNRVLFSIFSTIVIFGFFIFLTNTPEQGDGLVWPVRPPWLGVNSLFLSLLVASGLVGGQLFITSRQNLGRQAAYHQILSELQMLQQKGTMPTHALIISPAYGLPLEWANPLVLDFPTMQYLPLGWLTFSPPYEAVLQNYEVASLPAGFYQNDNVYLMASPGRLDGIRRFILEHAQVEVDATTLYEMPALPGEPAYIGVRLYKVALKR